MTGPTLPLWARLIWTALAVLHLYLAHVHLLHLPHGWHFEDIWKGFGATAAALLMAYWALRTSRRRVA